MHVLCYVYTLYIVVYTNQHKPTNERTGPGQEATATPLSTAAPVIAAAAAAAAAAAVAATQHRVSRGLTENAP